MKKWCLGLLEQVYIRTTINLSITAFSGCALYKQTKLAEYRKMKAITGEHNKSALIGVGNFLSIYSPILFP